MAEGQDGDLTPITLNEVLRIPGMDCNLLSSKVLLTKGLEISMHPARRTCRIVVALDDAEAVTQIVDGQYGGFIEARNNGFGRLWLVLHRLCIVLEWVLLSHYSLCIRRDGW
jgi:hypothetical protein